MTLQANPALRRFPLAERSDLASAAAVGPNRITDLTHRPRMGLRGRTTREWCTKNGLPFPDRINEVAAVDGLRVARLGQFELLVMSDSDAPLPESLFVLPEGTYSGYREEAWAWFRMEGPDAVRALASMTSADLRPIGGPAGRVVQTRFAGLDAVLILGGTALAPLTEIFADIASSEYLVDVFGDRCPEFALCKEA